MSWSTVKLGDICIKDGIQTGPFGSQLHRSDYSDSGIPVVMPVNLVNGRISSEKIARVSEVHAQRLSKYKLHAGDIVYARRGDIGRCARVTEKENNWLCGTGCLRLTSDPNKIDSDFLYYALSNYEVVNWVRSHAIGATMPNLNTKILETVPLLVADTIKEQRQIAQALCAYDRLIENNRKQIALLEETAQRLYKEWFVDLHYPGFKDATRNDNLPLSWRRMPISKYAQIIKGCSYTSKNIDAEHGIPMVNLASIAPWGGYKPYKERIYDGPYKSEQVLKPNDVVMALTEQTAGLAGYVARIPRYVQGSVLSMDLACLRPKKGTRAYLYCTFRYGNISRLLSPLANGTKIKHLKIETLDYTDMVVAPIELQQKFEDVVFPTFTNIDILMEENEALQTARNHLLPKLMSGEIEV